MSRRSDMAAGAPGERVAGPRMDAVAAARDAAFTGLIACGLFLPLIAFKTDVNGSNELVLVTRWPLFAAIVAVTAGGRFLYSLVIAPWLAERVRRPTTSAPSAWREVLRNWFIPFAIAFVIAYLAIVFATAGRGGALKWID